MQRKKSGGSLTKQHAKESVGANQSGKGEPSADPMLALMRNLLFSAAATCLAGLLGILQVGATDEALRVSIFGAAIGVPLCVGAAFVFEMLLLSGEYGRAWFDSKNRGYHSVVFVAGFALVSPAVVIGGIVYHLVPRDIYLFSVATLGAYIYVIVMFYVIRKWIRRVFTSRKAP